MIIKMGGGPVTEEEAARSKDTGITIHTMEEVVVSSSEGGGRCGEGQREGENVEWEGKREMWRGKEEQGETEGGREGERLADAESMNTPIISTCYTCVRISYVIIA